PLFKKLTLELGGKNPNIVFADSDMETALATGLRSSFENQGQICLCGSRIFVEKPAYADFVNRLVERTKKLEIGDPLEESTDQGAVVSRNHFDKVMSYLRLAHDEGGKVLCGGEAASITGRCAGGFFIRPSVIVDLPPQCRTNQEEIFGPVVT